MHVDKSIYNTPYCCTLYRLYTVYDTGPHTHDTCRTCHVVSYTPQVRAMAPYQKYLRPRVFTLESKSVDVIALFGW